MARKGHDESPVPIVFRSVKQLKEHPGRVIRDARKADVVITEHGTPTVLLCALAEHELEGAVLMQSPAIRRRMKRALQQTMSILTSRRSTRKTPR